MAATPDPRTLPWQAVGNAGDATTYALDLGDNVVLALVGKDGTPGGMLLVGGSLEALFESAKKGRGGKSVGWG